MVALLTITILTMICATSLYVTSQNTNATAQTASWHQALAGAESAVDQAMSALNKESWTGWYTAQYDATGKLPTSKPAPPNPIAATGYPALGSYNYYIPVTLAVSAPASGVQDESGKTVASWVTVDTNSSLLKQQSGQSFQAYRIRATGVVGAPGPARVSNSKLDNDLRKLSLRFDRFSGAAVLTPQAARRIEVVATPIVTSNSFSFLRAITTQNWVNMTGSGSIIDSFDSSSSLKSYPLGRYNPNPPYRQSHGDVSLVSSVKNNSPSDLSNNAVYGSLQYSGPAVKRTSGVQGTVSTPFNVTLPATSDPSGAFTPYTTNPNDATVIASGTSANNPTRLKISGDFSLQKNFTISAPAPVPSVTAQDTYLAIWVTGNYNTTGNALVTQSPNVHVTWYVDGDISTAGNAYVNQSNFAANLSFIAIGSGSITISGNGELIGTFYGPGRDVAFTGNASLIGAVVGDNLKLSSGASIHYDEALGSVDVFNSPVLSSYAYASWFEDNSDGTRSIAY